MAKQTKGYCKYCGKEYTKSGMLRHLPACEGRKVALEADKTKNTCGYFLVAIQGKYRKEYWLILEVNENALLKDLDQFLRDIWMECCGHLSMFRIGRFQYEVMPNTDRFWGPPARGMNYRMKDVFKEDKTATYEYDFGSTTEVVITIVDYRIGASRKEKIVILSRNHPIEFVCDQCGQNVAEWFCEEGIYDGTPFWCEECLEETGEDEEPDYLLPVCNSPRMGVCGYEGSTLYPEQFEPDKK